MDFDQIPAETLQKLLALTQRLTARRDLDSLLSELLDGSTALVPGADFVCVFLYRPELNALIPVGGVGFDMERLQSVQLKPGESLTGKAFLDRMPLLLPTPDAIHEAQKTLSPQNDRAVREAIQRPDNPVRSSMAIPLSAEGRTLGVLVIDNYDTDRDFGPGDLAVATSLADHAAVAVLNADDYQRARSLSENLQRTLALQQRLMASMMSANGSLEALVRTLSTILRRPFILFDAHHQTVAQYGQSLQQPMAFTIATGEECLGHLHVEGPVSGFDLVAVEQALPLFALEFVKSKAREQERGHAQLELFRRIWDDDSDAMEGLLESRQLIGPWRWALLARLSDATRDTLTTFATAEDIPWFRREKSLYMIVAEPQWAAVERESQQGHSTLFWGQPLVGRIKMGQELRALTHIWRSTYTFWPEKSWPPVVSLSDYPEFRALAAWPESVRKTLTEEVFAPFGNDAVLIETLKAWAFSERSFDRAARRLHTHPNTVRYRLDKAAQLAGQSLTDDHAIVRLRLAFYCRVDSHM